jgi:hypothetical protein
VQQIAALATDVVGIMPLLRNHSEEAGQSTANMGIVGVTIACLVWSMALLSGVDLKPGLTTLYQATEPLRQMLQDFIER